MTKSQHQLAHAIQSLKITIHDGLNSLQKAGVISDNCVTIEDVADEDARRAVRFLKEWPREER